jgi:imidazolonepropionase-like amidohydrolase
VLVNDGRITSIRQTGNVPLPAGTRKLDGRGKYLIPGLWDMHVHITHDCFREVFLAHGVTGVRHMYSFDPWSSPRRWREAMARGKAIAPRLVMTDSMVDGPRAALPWLLRRNVYPVHDARSAREQVDKFKTRGEDFVKVYPCLSRKAFLAVLEQAAKVGLPVAGHVPHAISVAEASFRGMACVEHLSGVALACSSKERSLRLALVRDMESGRLTGMDAATGWRTQVQAYNSYDPDKAAALFWLFASKGTWQVPTLVQKRAWGRLGETDFTRDDRLDELPGLLRKLWKVETTKEGVRLPRAGITFPRHELTEHRRQFRKDMEVVEAMHNAGVPLLAGTDTPSPYSLPGSALHDELELLVEAGLSPLAALQTATRNPARFLQEKDLGTVEVGKLADLVLLDADPLKDIGNTRSIAAVILGGRLLDRRTVQKADPTKPADKNRTPQRVGQAMQRAAWLRILGKEGSKGEGCVRVAQNAQKRQGALTLRGNRHQWRTGETAKWGVYAQHRNLHRNGNRLFPAFEPGPTCIVTHLRICGLTKGSRSIPRPLPPASAGSHLSSRQRELRR